VKDFDEVTQQHISVKCEGCDKTFDGIAQDAFDEGWDVRPWFTTHVTCPDCPITKTVWWSLASKETPKSYASLEKEMNRNLSVTRRDYFWGPIHFIVRKGGPTSQWGHLIWTDTISRRKTLDIWLGKTLLTFRGRTH